ncbi:MAG: hypothetical protein L7F78_15130 [Syntrophales bacterium LBB04]|nr:hypothetical protein [Syntrophales bacterium LBB04]
MLKVIYAVFGAVVFLVVAYHGLNSYIDSRIESKIHNTDYLKKLSRSVRPSLVFDEKGSILADMGAVPFISNISVSKTAKGSIKIVISPAEYLAIEPMLEALDDQYTIRAERGEKFDWIFHLAGIQILVTDSSPRRDKGRFRLEIIR